MNKQNGQKILDKHTELIFLRERAEFTQARR